MVITEMEIHNWNIVKRPGPFGKRRDEIFKGYDTEYGKNNWRIQWQFGNQTVPFEIAIQSYEDAYYEFLKKNNYITDWLISTAKDVYDNDKTNVNSGLDYLIQENSSNHYQDISIRRVIMRLGKQFEGTELIEIRDENSKGGLLSPGIVPFHIPQLITEPHISGWWNYDSIEDFWQSNKVIEIKKK